MFWGTPLEFWPFSYKTLVMMTIWCLQVLSDQQKSIQLRLLTLKVNWFRKGKVSPTSKSGDVQQRLLDYHCTFCTFNSYYIGWTHFSTCLISCEFESYYIALQSSVISENNDMNAKYLNLLISNKSYWTLMYGSLRWEFSVLTLAALLLWICHEQITSILG